MQTIKEYGYLACYSEQHICATIKFSKKFPDKILASFDWFHHHDDAKYNIYIQCEPPSMWKDRMKLLEPHKNKYDLFLGYQKEILELDNSQFFLPVAGWINPPYNINKLPQISFFTSNKLNTKDHKFRFEVWEFMKNRHCINDLYYKFWRSPPYANSETRNSFYIDSMFNIACENEVMDNGFSEKLIDCFSCKTVPIYYGCTNIDEFFNPKGILTFRTIEEFDDIINSIDKKLYESMLPYIEENYERSKLYWQKTVYQRLEDLITEKYYSNERWIKL